MKTWGCHFFWFTDDLNLPHIANYRPAGLQSRVEGLGRSYLQRIAEAFAPFEYFYICGDFTRLTTQSSTEVSDACILKSTSIGFYMALCQAAGVGGQP